MIGEGWTGGDEAETKGDMMTITLVITKTKEWQRFRKIPLRSKNEGPDQPPALYVGWPTKSKKD